MDKKLQLVVCPYCGHAQNPASKCDSCGGLFDLFSLTATEIDMGPWYLRDDGKPFLPGFSYQVLVKRVESGRITKETVIRGPTTRQLWTKAGHAPCVAHLLGSCHACGADAKPTDSKCRSCGALFTESTERQELGLRFRTAYQAATARLELNRQIAEAEERAKAATEAKKKRAEEKKQQARQKQDTKPTIEPIADDWNWAQAPAQPIDPEDEAAGAQDTAPDEPQPVAAGADESRFATQTMIHQPPPGAGPGSASALFNTTSRRFGAHADDVIKTAAPPLISTGAWCWIALIGALFVLLFQHFIIRMALIAWRSPDWSHALIIPLISLYFVWQRRESMRHMPRQICWWGLPIIFGGLFSYAFWIEPGRNDMLQGYSMIITLFGVVLLLLGTRMMGVLWLPIAFLAFGIKVSDAIWLRLAAKLQLLAAQASTVMLQFAGSFTQLDASQRGTTIELSFMRDGAWITGQELNVAEACSGLRMLAAFTALGVLVAFMSPRTTWQRWILVIMTVPIALLVNVGRVTILGLLYPINPDMAAGAFHQYVGLFMLIPALLLYLLLGWILDRVYVYDHPPAEAPAPAIETEQGGDLPLVMTFTQRVSNTIKGALTGIMLCVLVGATYGLGLLTLRPDMAGADFSQATGVQMLIGSVALLGGAAWFVKVLIAPEILRPRIVGRTVTLGLTAGVLLGSLLGMQAIINRTKVVMIKQPIELRQPLFAVPRQVGDWHLVREEGLNEDILDALGTKLYLSRVYEDRSLETGATGRFVKLHLAYYTGTPDTVPHVPERCFVAGGATPVDETTAPLQLRGDAFSQTGGQWMVKTPHDPSGIRLSQNPIVATQFTFVPAGNPGAQANVIYFFSCNGRFFSTPEGVRLKGYDPRDKYSYYCKIEVLLPDVADVTIARNRTSQFLSDMLPQIIACLPNWDDI